MLHEDCCAVGRHQHGKYHILCTNEREHWVKFLCSFSSFKKFNVLPFRRNDVMDRLTVTSVNVVQGVGGVMACMSFRTFKLFNF